MKALSLTQHTLFADLQQRCLDASFEDQFPENGHFSKVTRGDRSYWYYKGYETGSGRRSTRYVGPADDPAIERIVERFETNKTSYRERRELVRTLTEIGLPSPDAFVGKLVEAMWKAGFFRLRGVLVGTVAYQTYSGLLGVRLDRALAMTSDIDFAQFHAISASVGDSLPPILDVLRAVDPTFREVPHVSDAVASVAFSNEQGFRIDFLTPNRGGDEHQGKPAQMPALGGASAQPLRYLDFLIHKPVRSVMLHNAGVPVLVPAAERYAVHKLIVSTQRKAQIEASFAKSRKDLEQAESLILAFELLGRSADLGYAWMEAWDRGPQWRRNLAVSVQQLDDDAIATLKDAVSAACREDRKDVSSYWPEAAPDGPLSGRA